MNSFNRLTAVRIATVSLLLAAVASPVAWFVARENAEESTVLLAMEESQRLVRHFDVFSMRQPDAVAHATRAAGTIAGGLFDIAEIYDGTGERLAEAMTADGAQVEGIIPHHARPAYSAASYESLKLPDGRWVMRVFIPLRMADGSQSPIDGYFEGVRVIPDWQRQQMLGSALSAALMAGLASMSASLRSICSLARISALMERPAPSACSSSSAPDPKG